MRHLITSALPYINGVKHLGNLAGSMLPADVYARFLRQTGHDVLFICATDEHGTPAELAAHDAGLSVEEYCAQQHDRQERVSRGFALSFDYFGRSSSVANREMTQHFAHALDRAGFIEERTVPQVYSPVDGRFLPDRYVVGTCPYCGYQRARGDQCENCTRLLEPTDLIAPASAISGSTELEVRPSKHLYLLQSKLAGEIEAWLTTHPEWPPLVRGIALSWLGAGLQDRAITRDLRWGVPVDRPGFEGKVFYVWFDAPIEYLGATREYAEAIGRPDCWRDWWYDPAGVRYTQFMAKDNVPFHAVTFPATIIGSREPWKRVDYIKGFNWLDYYGRKFSTSEHLGVFMEDALALLPADYWRYYLIAQSPESGDSTFTWEHFAATVNKDLASVFGNFVNRVLRFARTHFDNHVPARTARAGDDELVVPIFEQLAAYRGYLASLDFRKAMGALREAWSLGNVYLDRRAPWKAIKEDRSAAADVVSVALNLINVYAVASAPIMPATCARIRGALGFDEEPAWLESDVEAALGALTPGTRLGDLDVLFARIDDEQVAAWRERFGGLPAQVAATE